MADRDHLFQRLCQEAVTACGANHEAVERYVRERIAAMGEADREMMTRDLNRVLGFEAPSASPFTH